MENLSFFSVLSLSSFFAMINRKVKVFLYKLKKEGREMQDFNVTFRYAIQRERERERGERERERKR